MQSNYSVDIRHSFSISSQKKKKKKKISYTSRSISIKYAWNRSRIKERKHSLENKGCAANFFFSFSLSRRALVEYSIFNILNAFEEHVRIVVFQKCL